MGEDTSTDLYKLAISGLFMSLIINLIIIGYGIAPSQRFSNTPIEYNSTMFKYLPNNQPEQITCIQGDTTCTDTLTQVPNEESNIIDSLQSIINTGKLIAWILWLIALTPIMPMYITGMLTLGANPLITNGWLQAILWIFTTLWTALNCWIIFKFIFKK